MGSVSEYRFSSFLCIGQSLEDSGRRGRSLSVGLGEEGSLDLRDFGVLGLDGEPFLPFLPGFFLPDGGLSLILNYYGQVGLGFLGRTGKLNDLGIETLKWDLLAGIGNDWISD